MVFVGDQIKYIINLFRINMEYKLGLVLYVGVLNINILILLFKIITVVQKQIKSNVLQYFSDAYDLVTACGSCERLPYNFIIEMIRVTKPGEKIKKKKCVNQND